MVKISVPFFSILFFFIPRIILAQISPGELTKAHAHLEGLSNCTKCHVLGEQVYNSKCLDCHSEINNLIRSKKGYHSSSEVAGKDCWSCHSEHFGRNFRIINFDPKSFNHYKTGFELTGAHKEAECNSCHQKKFISDPEIKKRSSTYLGLLQECISCHEDFHIGMLSEKCSDCHNTEKFKPASGFNHENASFKIDGAHKKVECNKCHPLEEKNGKIIQKFKLHSFSNCSSCHKDFHNGKFGPDCRSCHSTNSFHQINESAFNHNKTNFPLIGKHNFVKCSDCHKENLTEKINHQECIDCHKDYHKGEFTENNSIKDCSNCHNEFGFSPALFTIEKHNTTRFKLTGSHLAVPCVSCHLKNNEWHFRSIGIKCIDCHNNVHGQEISSKITGNNDCSICHNPESWFRVSFEHNKTGYDLIGKHTKVSCRGCHLMENSVPPLFKFASLGNSCLQCHKDFHYGQFRDIECERCHGFDDWKPEKFNHNNTRFPLQGAHLKLQCGQCHKIVNEKNFYYTQFKLLKFKCADCHS